MLLTGQAGYLSCDLDRIVACILVVVQVSSAGGCPLRYSTSQKKSFPTFRVNYRSVRPYVATRTE